MAYVIYHLDFNTWLRVSYSKSFTLATYLEFNIYYTYILQYYSYIYLEFNTYIPIYHVSIPSILAIYHVSISSRFQYYIPWCRYTYIYVPGLIPIPSEVSFLAPLTREPGMRRVYILKQPNTIASNNCSQACSIVLSIGLVPYHEKEC